MIKFLVQKIFDFIVRFRSDVYLESIADAGEDTDKFLVAKSDGKVTYRTGAEVLSDIRASSEATNLEFSGSTANGILTYGGAVQIDVEPNMTFASDALSLTSASSNLPSITLTNSNTDANASKFSFVKTATGAVMDEIGIINFTADNAANEPTSFVEIVGLIKTETDTDEAGTFAVSVATSDGSNSTLRDGISLVGSNANDDVDVNLGYGTTSITKIKGTLTMGSTAFVNNSGVIQVATQGTIDHDSLTNFEAEEHYRWDTDISSTATINAANIPTLNQNTSGSAATVTSIGNLTGDVTSSNRATTIADDAVTYAKMQNVSATNVVLGRDSAGAGVVEEISAANLRTILNVADGATADQTNVSGTAATVTAAAQPNITSVGTLTSLDVDSINLNNKRIIITGDTDDTFDITSTTHGATTIATTDTAGAQANLDFLIDGGITATSTSFTATTDDFTIVSSTSTHPTVMIANTTSDASGGELVLHNKRSGGGVNGDICGLIHFKAPNHDASDNFIFYSSIVGSIAESNDTDEAGKLELYVTTSSGSSSTPKAGLVLTGNGSDNDVDVTIGAETTSLTTIAGDLAIDGGNITTAVEVDGLLTAGANIRVGGSGRTSNNWITIDAQAGNDSSGGGVVFYETQTDTLGSPQYGAKIVYNETADEFAIGTMQNSVFQRQIYMPRGNDYVFFADAAYIEGASPSLQFQSTDTSIVSTNSLGDLNWKSADDGGVTLKLRGIATETHSSNSAGGSKLEFHVTPNTTTATALAVTIDQDKSLTVEGDLQVNGNLTANKRKFTIPGNTPGNHDGDVVYFGGEAETLAAGQVVHYNSSGNWELVDPTNSTKSVGLLGIMLGSDAGVHGVLLRGMVTHDHDPGDVGQALYLKATGDISSSAPTGSGNIVRVVGYCLDASNGQVWFNPDSTYIEI